MKTTAKLFKNGRSQAVRLPKEFRFKGTEVKIRMEGSKVILEPLETADWPAGFWDMFTPDPEFVIPYPGSYARSGMSFGLLMRMAVISEFAGKETCSIHHELN